MGADRFEATSEAGFIQLLACNLLPAGYHYYAVGDVPAGKDAAKVDAKLVARYGIGLSRWAKARRKRQGLANVAYLRFKRTFVLLATKGTHPIFADEAMRDFRRDSLTFSGHSIGYKRGRDGRMHASVRIHPEEYLRTRDYFLERAVRASAAALERELGALHFQPYAPVRAQLLSILRKTNRARAEAGLEPVSRQCLRLFRRQVRPFATPEERRAA